MPTDTGSPTSSIPNPLDPLGLLSEPTTPKPAAKKAAAKKTPPKSNAVFDAIGRAARELGVPIDLALAIAYHESGLNPKAVGDNRSSFGLFQLHRGGELGTLTQAQANDPYTNAKRALTTVAKVMRQNPGWSYGQIAAAAQRPANQSAYAAAIDGLHSSQGSQDALSFYASKPTNTTVYQPLTTAGSTASAKSIKDQVATKYGYLSSFLDDPEIGPLLIKATQQDWDADRLQGALTATKWWKTHSDVTRTFDAQGKLDPASQKAQIAGQVSQLHAEMRQLGLIVDPKRLAQMAVNSLRFGWNAQQIRNSLVNEGKFDLSGKSGSAALTLRDDLKSRAAQYLVPVGDQTLMQWVKNVSKGEVSEQDFDGYLKEQAKSLFPTMGAAIDAGVTPSTYVEPYKQIAAQTLELDPASVQFTQPKWQKALFQVDPKTGQRSAMSLADWQNTLRTDKQYGYDQTQQAKSAGADLISQMEKTFGTGG